MGLILQDGIIRLDNKPYIMDNSVSSLFLALEQHDLIVRNYSLTLPKGYEFNNGSESALKMQDFHSADNYVDGFHENEFTYSLVQKLFSEISSSDENTRTIALNILTNGIISWANRHPNNGQTASICCQTSDLINSDSARSMNSDNVIPKNHEKTKAKDYSETKCGLMQVAVAAFSSLQVCCPHYDVRSKCRNVLSQLKVSLIVVYDA